MQNILSQDVKNSYICFLSTLNSSSETEHQILNNHRAKVHERNIHLLTRFLRRGSTKRETIQEKKKLQLGVKTNLHNVDQEVHREPRRLSREEIVNDLILPPQESLVNATTLHPELNAKSSRCIKHRPTIILITRYLSSDISRFLLVHFPAGILEFPGKESRISTVPL